MREDEARQTGFMNLGTRFLYGNERCVTCMSILIIEKYPNFYNVTSLSQIVI